MSSHIMQKTASDTFRHALTTATITFCDRRAPLKGCLAGRSAACLVDLTSNPASRHQS